MMGPRTSTPFQNYDEITKIYNSLGELEYLFDAEFVVRLSNPANWSSYNHCLAELYFEQREELQGQTDPDVELYLSEVANFEKQIAIDANSGLLRKFSDRHRGLIKQTNLHSADNTSVFYLQVDCGYISKHDSYTGGSSFPKCLHNALSIDGEVDLYFERTAIKRGVGGNCWSNDSIDSDFFYYLNSREFFEKLVRKASEILDWKSLQLIMAARNFKFRHDALRDTRNLYELKRSEIDRAYPRKLEGLGSEKEIFETFSRAIQKAAGTYDRSGYPERWSELPKRLTAAFDSDAFAYWALQERSAPISNHQKGADFEKAISNALKQNGFQIEQTPSGPDYGVDLIAEKNGLRIAIQCKDHNNLIGIKAVQEVIAGAKHFGCDGGVVISTSEFTRAAADLANSNSVGLITENQLSQNPDVLLFLIS